MITDLPTPQDFFEAGIELFDFAWATAAGLLTTLSRAEEFGVDAGEVSEPYWAAAKRRLMTALAVTQQGVEFILKGKIAEISPYLLLVDSPDRWPSPYDGRGVTFSQFKTVDAQDLIRVHDIVCETLLPSHFVDQFNALRAKRNAISHSIDKQLRVKISDVIEAILFFHKVLLPDQNWAKIRAELIATDPDAVLSYGEFSVNAANHELSAVIALLPPAAVSRFFGIDKKQRRYFCPNCLDNANHEDEIEQLAVLRPKGATGRKLFCMMCDAEHLIVRGDCGAEGCSGNVISEDGVCLTCGR